MTADLVLRRPWAADLPGQGPARRDRCCRLNRPAASTNGIERVNVEGRDRPVRCHSPRSACASGTSRCPGQAGTLHPCLGTTRAPTVDGMTHTSTQSAGTAPVTAAAPTHPRRHVTHPGRPHRHNGHSFGPGDHAPAHPGRTPAQRTPRRLLRRPRHPGDPHRQRPLGRPGRREPRPTGRPRRAARRPDHQAVRLRRPRGPRLHRLHRVRRRGSPSGSPAAPRSEAPWSASPAR